MKTANPIARFEGIVVQELPNEVLILDSEINRAFCLNQTLAEVWKLADGNLNIRQISQAMSRKFRSEINEDLVLFALGELAKENLLVRESFSFEAKDTVSRREIIRRIGYSSAVALPIITGVLVPQSTHAASVVCPTGTACRCRYTSLPAATSCANTDPLECNSGCSCFYGNPNAACAEATPGNFVCLGVCQS
jgi:hypothetical protein